MEFLRLEQGEALAVGERISPIRLRDILPTGAKEADLEDLLVRYPGLMNWDEYNGEEPDLLVVSRQAKTFRNKRLDLLAVDTDGTLVVIEVKRDAADERVRTEAAEFQAIRYAANVCTLSAEEVVGLFAEHLAKSESGSLDDEAEAYAWRRKAERALAKHLGVKDPSDQEGLRAAIRPSEKQRICLVAADFDAEVTAACAWLLEHGVDIACFRLQPYRIDSVLCLNRERVVPPPDLGDFFGHMAAQHGVTGAGRHSDGPRRSADKPVFLSLGGSESSLDSHGRQGS